MPSFLTCVVVVIDGDCGGVGVAQHGFGGGAMFQGGGAILRIANQTGVAQVHVEVFVFLKDVIVNHANGDF